MIAYENGADLGADYIECDVQITKVSSLLLKVSISYVIINYFDKIAGQLKIFWLKQQARRKVLNSGGGGGRVVMWCV